MVGARAGGRGRAAAGTDRAAWPPGSTARPGWQLHAACRGADVSLFFPPGENPVLVASARAICSTCPVTADCLEAGLSEPEGIWGGRTGEERERLRRMRPAPA